MGFNASSLPPPLQYFYNHFNNRECRPSGILVGTMDDLSIQQGVNLVGAYYVCAEKIRFAVTEFIRCKGPGGGLIAAPRLELQAPEIEFEGTPDDPIQIVATETLSLQATTLKMKNAVLYLFGNAHFSIDALAQWSIENVRIIRFTGNDQTIAQQEIACWRNNDDIRTMIENPALK